MGKYPTSDALYERAVIIPERSLTRSKAPGRFFDIGRGPLYAESGRGAYLTDVDGKQYIDMLCALGAISLGYGRETRTARDYYAHRPSVYSLPHRAEVTAAEAVLKTVAPWASRVRFTKTGSEATHAAYRIAKAVGGPKRNVVLVGDWAYHGWHEWCGDPKGVGVVTYPHNFDLVDVIDPDAVAAVFIEPHRWEPVDAEWLRAVRRYCDTNAVLLVFDEMIYGGRWAKGGATEYFGVTPDLACFGKAIGNGASIACVVGGEILDTHGSMVSGTYSGDVGALAALIDTLHAYECGDGFSTAVIAVLWARGTQLQRGLKSALADTGYPARLEGAPVHQRIVFDDKADGREFSALMADRHVLWHPEVANVMYAHSIEDIERVVTATYESLRAMMKAGRS